MISEICGSCSRSFERTETKDNVLDVLLQVAECQVTHEFPKSRGESVGPPIPKILIQHRHLTIERCGFLPAPVAVEIGHESFQVGFSFWNTRNEHRPGVGFRSTLGRAVVGRRQQAINHDAAHGMSGQMAHERQPGGLANASSPRNLVDSMLETHHGFTAGLSGVVRLPDIDHAQEFLMELFDQVGHLDVEFPKSNVFAGCRKFVDFDVQYERRQLNLAVLGQPCAFCELQVNSVYLAAILPEGHEFPGSPLLKKTEGVFRHQTAGQDDVINCGSTDPHSIPLHPHAGTLMGMRIVIPNPQRELL